MAILHTQFIFVNFNNSDLELMEAHSVFFHIWMLFLIWKCYIVPHRITWKTADSYDLNWRPPLKQTGLS